MKVKIAPGSDGVYVNELQAAVELILRQRAVDGIILSHKYSLSFLIRIFGARKKGAVQPCNRYFDRGADTAPLFSAV